MKLCNHLAEIVRSLRGSDNYVKFARRTKVNRQTLTELEQGESVRIETLQRIAVAYKLDDRQWAEMLIAWIRCALGEKEYAKLDVRPAPTKLVVKELQAEDELYIKLFHRLGNIEKSNILKAMMRQEVRSCLPAINEVWERGMDLDKVLTHEVPQDWEDVATDIANLKEAPQTTFQAIKNFLHSQENQIAPHPKQAVNSPTKKPRQRGLDKP